jgi:hypothetical protein
LFHVEIFHALIKYLMYNFGFMSNINLNHLGCIFKQSLPNKIKINYIFLILIDELYILNLLLGRVGYLGPVYLPLIFNLAKADGFCKTPGEIYRKTLI